MDLGRRIASRLEAATFERIAGVGLENAALNRPRIERLLRSATQLSEQLGHPHAGAWVALCRGASAFFIGD